MIIAGTRVVNNILHVVEAVKESGFDITVVVSGTCRGVDKLAEDWAFFYGIPVKPFKPDWKKYGKYAGPKRNADMAEYADALIAVWDGESRGTKDMINKAKEFGLKTHIYRTDRIRRKDG